jgi:uncharacterized protein (TIGR02444 family)
MDSPFWNFSLAVYGANAVENECLGLQDQFGIDVNLVLLCAYLGAVHGAALTAGDIASARAEAGLWHEQIVRPLRAARRSLKAIALRTDDETKAAAQLRIQVKAIELESERVEQMTLGRWAEARLASWPRGNSREAVTANLHALLAGYGGGAERLAAAEAAKHLIAAALEQVVIK